MSFRIRFGQAALTVALLVTALFSGSLPAAAQDTGTIVPLDHPMAPFLESRAFAASVGATNEFRKMEWVAFDPVNNKLYWAMSEVSKGMSDGAGAVNVEENLCGIVYAGDVDADFNVASITPLIVGGPYDEANEENPCDVNNIANPDNLYVDPAGRLWIGEDTSNHANNVLWMWDGTLHRFATVPTGAETTGVFVTAEGSLFFNAQHPSGRNIYPYNRGFLGVVTGFKATDSFSELPAPQGPDRNKVLVAAGEYQMLGRAGTLIPNAPSGERFGEVIRPDGSRQAICNQPDANMFVPTVEDGSAGYLYTNYECPTAGVSQLYIRNDGAAWEVVEGQMVDASSVNGVWTLCGGAVSPWNTALTAEEYEPIASIDGWQQNIADMSDYLGEQANPYDYGYIVEMMPDEDGDTINAVLQKRYAMGRFSHENAIVMPDLKTVYHGDDGTDVVFFKFVADEAGDLSAGTLYAARATQGENGSFGLEWLELGHGNDDEIAEAIATLELPE